MGKRRIDERPRRHCSAGTKPDAVIPQKFEATRFLHWLLRLPLQCWLGKLHQNSEEQRREDARYFELDVAPAQ
jgi:hypothetical protein